MSLSTPPPAPLVRTLTIPELARQLGRPRSSVFRQIRALHRSCRAHTCEFWKADPTPTPEDGARHALWLVRPADGRAPWRINRSRLEVAHPELYGLPSAREMHEMIVETRSYAREGIKAVNMRVGAVAAAMREHARRHHGGAGQ